MRRKGAALGKDSVGGVPIGPSPGLAAPPPASGPGLATQALETGQAALTAGDIAGAVRWLDRAARLAPGDPVVALALGVACLAGEPGRAAALFESVPAALRPREGWWGLVAARLALGDATGAAEVLGWVLARFVMHRAWAGLAGAVVHAVGAAGWCGIGSDDRVPDDRVPNDRVIVAAPAGAHIVRRLDGRRVASERPTTAAGRLLEVRANGVPLLGSPLRLDAIRRIEGCVAVREGTVRGWAWRPADPDSEPTVTLRTRGSGVVRVACGEPPPDDLPAGPLVRAHGFSASAAALVGAARRSVRVLDEQGRDLSGSPFDVDLPADPGVVRRRRAREGPPRQVPSAHPPAVVVSVQGGADAAMAGLDAVLATVPDGTCVVVVDDGRPEPDLRQALRRLAATGRVRLIPSRKARGSAGAINAGVAACPGRDVVLLGGGALPAAGWIERLRAVADGAADIGTVTPFSDAHGITHYPGVARAAPMPGAAGVARLAALAWRAGGARSVDIPAGEGACLYVRRACWDQAGPLRTALFVPGGGAETDFYLRAGALGWRHVAAPGVFVGGAGEVASGVAAALRARNRDVLERLHPGHAAAMAAFRAADPLAPARRRLDRARWAAARKTDAPPATVLLITHADGGGVERVVAAACRAHRAAGRRAIVLRPAAGAGRGHAVVLEGPDGGELPGLRFALPREAPAFLRLLRAEPMVGIELHHLLGHPPAVTEIVAALGVPYEVYVHDYAWVCPRVTLTRPGGVAGAAGPDRYCGAPGPAACVACIATHGSLLDEPIGVRALRRRSTALLRGARRVVVASADTAVRLRRYVSGVGTCIAPPEDDAELPPAGAALPPAAAPPPPAGRLRVCVVGAIGAVKGVDVLLACAVDAARRNLPLEFVVVGPTTADAALLATGRVFVTGPFRPEEATALIRAQGAQLALLPSVWPETWCFALTDVWRAGLDVVAFDLGAPAARIRRTGRGTVLPPDLPAGRINEMLLARGAIPVHL